MSCQCLGRCDNIAPQTRRDEKQNVEGATGTEKHKWRRGRAKGERQQTQQTPQTQPRKEETERREGVREQTLTPHTTNIGASQRGADNQTATTMEGEGKEGDEPGYSPTPEDLCLQEVYGDWFHANPSTHLNGGIRDMCVVAGVVA